jgi:hypothetical protein
MKHLTPAFFVVTTVFALTGCPDEWADYDIQPPPASARVWLDESPFVPQAKACVSADAVDVPEGTQLEGGELCVWEFFSGNVPAGLQFTDVASCGPVFSQGPGWFTKPQRVYESPASLLDDEQWVAEAEWVKSQIHAGGCSCCHASSSGSGNTSGFDFDAPGVFTDSMTNSQLSMSAGMNDMHQLFGAFDAADNHGFQRDLTIWASTDPERMRAFFEGEFERRGGGQQDLDEAQAAFDALFGQVVEDTGPCVTEFEGVRDDGTIYWNGDGTVRRVWIMEEGTPSPAFPPNLDLPAGTLWALYVDVDGEPIANDTLRIGDVPTGSTQQVPAMGMPQLVDGTTYKIYANRDVMVGQTLNCTFTWGG